MVGKSGSQDGTISRSITGANANLFKDGSAFNGQESLMHLSVGSGASFGGGAFFDFSCLRKRKGQEGEAPIEPANTVCWLFIEGFFSR